MTPKLTKDLSRNCRFVDFFLTPRVGDFVLKKFPSRPKKWEKSFVCFHSLLITPSRAKNPAKRLKCSESHKMSISVFEPHTFHRLCLQNCEKLGRVSSFAAGLFFLFLLPKIQLGKENSLKTQGRKLKHFLKGLLNYGFVSGCLRSTMAQDASSSWKRAGYSGCTSRRLQH